MNAHNIYRQTVHTLYRIEYSQCCEVVIVIQIKVQYSKVPKYSPWFTVFVSSAACSEAQTGEKPQDAHHCICWQSSWRQREGCKFGVLYSMSVATIEQFVIYLNMCQASNRIAINQPL